ncbi:dolichol-phosphate mannosyltransferase [Promicromonospora umidemergens]|uniref:Polyprenol monophosphomannose synthase n=1 Tax=Promicromonospora umidemergens TaxID=629679 RepID=A0ABP8XKV6_9MICO|nr:polyprenol monophosphomannose synthase [Promicromonospora umidemergens]MCP2285683.1 dolichol-phosphate mannosyltransferase [Promicromonospora umidemergens]
MHRTLVIIPTFNEVENLEPIVDRVLAATSDADILVVDDASPDGTGELGDRLAEQHPEVSVLHRAEKNGLGGAYLSGFSWGLERGYGALVEMDADGSHQPEQLPLLLEQLTDHDVVLGSRWVPGGRVENWSRRRVLLSRAGNRYARLALGIDVRDATGGYRAFSAAALRRVDLEHVASQGYCFQIDLLWRALERQLRVVEVPITFVERVRGESKMSGSIVVESLGLVTWWGVRRRLAEIGALLRHRRKLPSVRALSHRTLPPLRTRSE